MSNSRKKSPAKKKAGAAKKSAVLSQKNLILTAVAVVALVVILVIAFSGPETPPAVATPAATTPAGIPSGSDAAQLVTNAPGKLTILCDVKLTLGYDASGNVIALTGDSDPARTVAAQCDIVGMSCADAMAVIIPLLEGERTQGRSYYTIRQDQTGVTPSETFMTEIRDAVKAVTELPVVTIAASEMDENGYFDQDKARAFIRAVLGERAEITYMTEMHEGKYLATVTVGEDTQDYIIGAVDGSVVPDSYFTNDEPYDETFHQGMGEATDDNPNPEEEEDDKEENQVEDGTEENKQETPSTEENKNENTNS